MQKLNDLSRCLTCADRKIYTATLLPLARSSRFRFLPAAALG